MMAARNESTQYSAPTTASTQAMAKTAEPAGGLSAQNGNSPATYLRSFS